VTILDDHSVISYFDNKSDIVVKSAMKRKKEQDRQDTEVKLESQQQIINTKQIDTLPSTQVTKPNEVIVYLEDYQLELKDGPPESQ
jgi:hypothetical protein